MKKQSLNITRDTLLSVTNIKPGKIDEYLKDLDWSERTEFTNEDKEIIVQYAILREHYSKKSILNEKKREEESFIDCVIKLYKKLEKGDKQETEITKYSFKKIKETIEKQLKRKITLSEMEVILGMSELGVEDDYTGEQKERIDRSLEKYESSRKEEMGSLEDILSRDAERMAGSLLDNYTTKKVETEEKYARLAEVMPMKVLEEFSKLHRSGELDRRVEEARRKLARSKVDKGLTGVTTIDVLVESEHKQLEAADDEREKENG